MICINIIQLNIFQIITKYSQIHTKINSICLIQQNFRILLTGIYFYTLTFTLHCSEFPRSIQLKKCRLQKKSSKISSVGFYIIKKGIAKVDKSCPSIVISMQRIPSEKSRDSCFKTNMTLAKKILFRLPIIIFLL